MTMIELPAKLLPLSDNQRDLLEDVARGAEPGKTWASSQLIQRATKLGLIVWTYETGTQLTELGKIALEISQAHGYSLNKKLLGGSPIAGGGNRYGVSIRCRCGWKRSTNEGARNGGQTEMRQAHAQHVQELLAEKLR
jgi:hypothetical protein